MSAKISFLQVARLHFVLQIVDSIMALFRVDFSGRGELSERQQKVRYHRINVDILSNFP